ncbi:MAG: hypothetical protein ACRDXC_03325 [Acidimicrobiales bacterium]
MRTNESHSDGRGGSGSSAHQRKAAPRGALPLIALTAAFAIGLSACGGGSPQTPGVASLGTTTSTTVGKVHPSGIKFAECMRAHGITNFPDPGPTGNMVFNVSGGINPSSARFRSALTSCKKYNPVRSGTVKPGGPSKAVLLEYAKCMRAHGVANFPDPVLFSGSTWGFDLVGQVNQTSPGFQAANQACKSHAYGGIHPCGGTGGSRRSSSQERRC